MQTITLSDSNRNIKLLYKCVHIYALTVIVNAKSIGMYSGCDSYNVIINFKYGPQLKLNIEKHAINMIK